MVRVLAPWITRTLDIGTVGPPGLVIPAVMYVHVVIFTFFVPGISQLVCTVTFASVLLVALALTTAFPVLTLIDSEPAAFAYVASKHRANTDIHRWPEATHARFRNSCSLRP